MVDNVDFSSMESSKVTLMVPEQDGSVTPTEVMRIPLRDEFEVGTIEE